MNRELKECSKPHLAFATLAELQDGLHNNSEKLADSSWPEPHIASTAMRRAAAMQHTAPWRLKK